MCSNVKCPRRDLIPLIVCPHCQVAIYCTMVCQLLDWERIHCRNCVESNSTQRADMSDWLTDRNIFLLANLYRRRIRERARSLQTVAPGWHLAEVMANRDGSIKKTRIRELDPTVSEQEGELLAQYKMIKKEAMAMALSFEEEEGEKATHFCIVDVEDVPEDPNLDALSLLGRSHREKDEILKQMYETTQ